MAIFWLAVLATAAAPSESAPPRASIQQQFDAASDAVTARDCAKAVSLFEALERDPRLKRGSFAEAAAAVRKGRCLIRLGRIEEGEASIAKGLPQIDRAGASFAGDFTESEDALGDAAMTRWDYDSAKRHYQAALTKQTGGNRLASLSRLARTSAFDGGSAALAPVDEALAILAREPATPKDSLAQWRALRGRTLLNQGRNAEAYAELNAALVLSGGLTLRTSLAEASMRGDLALAALLLGKTDDARKFLAYTGQGRLAKSPFAVAASMAPPECGEITGLRPDDFAVVEFATGDDGRILGAQTVYSRGGPAVAAAFARAVDDWYWRPEDLKDIPAFYRVGIRVELRCSAAAGPSQNVGKDLFDRLMNWVSPQTGVAAPETGGTQAAAAAVARVAAEAKASGPFERYAAATAQQVMLAPHEPATAAAALEAVLATPEARCTTG